jgi:hypothetical protein
MVVTEKNRPPERLNYMRRKYENPYLIKKINVWTGFIGHRVQDSGGRLCTR